jgi:HK97 family phage prohead protease
MKGKKFDFAGYATRVGVRCSDGRTISRDAFLDNDKMSVPLVWQHMHSDPSNVLGHAELENRSDGVYAYCSFNESESARQARELVRHGDICSMSIYANSLVEKGKVVLHGVIREVSLVLAGANEGAKIENIAFEHSDGAVTEDESEAIITHMQDLSVDGSLMHADSETNDSDDDDETLADVFDTLSEKQKTVVYAMIGEVINNAEPSENKAVNHSEKGDRNDMKRNVFDKTLNREDGRNTLSHDQLKAIFADAQRCGSLKEAFLQHGPNGEAGVDYGITDINYLFPDHRSVTPEPKLIQRDTAWVADVFGAAHHVPFSRIKSLAADITADEARARGYITGNKKMEEVIPLLKRTTGPTTVYKKQKLDRDDITDIVDLDVVAWLKREMRGLLNEELARAVLTGDGRSAASDDKIREDCIRPIYTDDDLFSVKVSLPGTVTTMQTIDQIILSRKLYKGAGNPVFFSNPDTIGDMLLLKDTTGRRLYNTITDLAAALRVTKIVEVPILENISRVVNAKTMGLIGIIVNMKDYYIGADKGGAINLFDDFDIDYNQYKYLIETRCSGALITPHAALIIEKDITEEPESQG